MLEVRRRLDLGEEPLGTDDRCEFGLEHLQRDLALVLQVIREVDRRHPALAEFGLDAVAAFEGCVQAGDGVGGHWPIGAFAIRPVVDALAR